MEDLFNDGFLTSLSNWQRGWAERQSNRREIADKLISQCGKLPDEFREFKGLCYRKRFILRGEVVPILLNNDFFEGIASWSSNLNYAEGFKGIYREDSAFVAVFEHKPFPNEVVVNIISLWQNDDFKNAVKKFEKERPEDAKPLLNFKDSQSEIILRSTLKGNEIVNIVGTSSSFDEICDMALIPEKDRDKLSKDYAKNGIFIRMPIFAGIQPTKRAIQEAIFRMNQRLSFAR
jgi:hypothetical protein